MLHLSLLEENLLIPAGKQSRFLVVIVTRRSDSSLLCLGRDWTEYTLYWVYACGCGYGEALHAVPKQGKMLYDASFFEFGTFGFFDPDKSFADDHYLFTVVQVTCRVSPVTLCVFTIESTRSPLKQLYGNVEQ